MKEQIKKAIIALYNKLGSKKLLAFFVATCLLWFSKISGEIWETIAICYIGAQAVFDTATTWKHGMAKKKDKPVTDPDSPNNEQGP